MSSGPILNVEAALLDGYTLPQSGIFRAERCKIVNLRPDGEVDITLPESLEPEVRYVVHRKHIIQ